MSERMILPYFEVQNNDPTPLLSLAKMYDILIRACFTVHAIMNQDGQYLDLLLDNTPVNYLRFDVTLPDGWSLDRGYIYGKQSEEELNLLDEQGRWRFRISQEWYENSWHISNGEMFCRYQILKLPGFYKLPVEKSSDILDVVVDWAAVDPKEPQVCPVVVFHEYRPARSMPEPEEMRKLMNKAFAEEHARILARKPRMHPRMYAWLQETYPHYQDPVHYWN